jgi:hypothetical protein
MRVVTIETDWISPAQEITGRDHLAVQAVSEHLYTGLLPGLTNVTDRARCYTFYPWFVWAFDRRSKKKTPAELVRLFRRAECLHTLIGIAHELDTGDEWSHGAELAGRLKLVRVGRALAEGGTAKLSTYAAVEGDERYFKHKLGGLGQYYLGPLKELEVLDGNAQDGLKFTNEWGRTLAELYDHSVDGDAFFETVLGDRVDFAILKALRPFCPCHLRKLKAERDALVDLLFCRGEGDLRQERGRERRHTLTLLLDHARRLRADTDQSPGVHQFLSSCYTGFLPDRTAWPLPTQFDDVRASWGVYQQHELLAIAVQGLFWAGLSELLNDGGWIADAPAYATWFRKRFSAAGGLSLETTPFATLLQDRRGSLPAQDEWTHSDHELQHGQSLLAAQKQGDADTVVVSALQILLSLIARGFADAPYGTLIVPDRFFETYEINLLSVRNTASRAWDGISGGEWLQWLAGSWAIRVHFRVALRKLRYQMQDSFRIVPMDEGYRVREAPPAKWSEPRLAQALRFLYDLGALDIDGQIEGEPYALSTFGEQLLERELGRG